ncbi:MAG: SGNH/GDSL hydrolase family protein [Myxococcales bacterium]|nr:SGNH/GDSL hydrolase family protein [Myxococcales bacterium]MCB9714229.1 SGNH/GDSL hydrolase family protein [Myxococcales bacterium]
MVSRRWLQWSLAGALVGSACGDPAGSGSEGMDPSGIGEGSTDDGSTTTDDPAEGTTAADGSSGGAATTDQPPLDTGDTAEDSSTGDPTGEPPPVGLDDVGTLVILGDSIGDGGGQAPYYYTLLRDDLAAHYGPIEYHNRAQSGSETGALVGQIDGLPDQLPGPVVVVITSGGNDMKDDLFAVVAGLDGALIAQMSANIDAALGDLLAPGRFGAGVEVHVFEGNVYDASDGAGDFGSAGCNFAGGLPAIPSDAMFGRWNDGIRSAVEARGQTAVDMHEYFYGHGYHATPSWYASDCTHPNSLGHDQLRRLVFEHVTGESLP